MKSQSAKPNEVTIRLTGDQALVLFEWLTSKEEDETTQLKAETSVFDGVLAQLEKLLSEPFAENYADLLEGARRRLNVQGAAGE